MALRRFLWIAVLGYTAAHLAYSVIQYNIFQGAASGDFNRAFLEAAESRSFLNPLAQGWHFHPPFYYTILLGADALLGGMRNTSFFFYFIQFLLFPLAMVFLVKAAWFKTEKPPWAAYGAAAVLTVNFQPFLETLAQHKVEGIEFALICLALLLFRRKRDLWCGGVLMLAANLKYLPALLLAHFFTKREGKVALGSLLGAGVVVATLAGVFGPSAVSSGFLKNAAGLMLDHRHEGNRPEASVEMQTLSGTVNRRLARPAPPSSFMDYIRVGSYMPVPNPAAAQGIAGGLKILAVLGWLFFIRRRWKPSERAQRWPLHLLEISLSLTMIPVISQAARVHYSILVLPGFVIVGLLLLQQGKRFGTLEKSLFGLAYGLTGMLIPGGLLNRLPPSPVWGQHHSLMYLWWSLPFYGILLLGCCIIFCHRRLRREALS